MHLINWRENRLGITVFSNSLKNWQLENHRHHNASEEDDSLNDIFPCFLCLQGFWKNIQLLCRTIARGCEITELVSLKMNIHVLQVKQDRFPTCFKTCGTNSWGVPKVRMTGLVRRNKFPSVNKLCLRVKLFYLSGLNMMAPIWYWSHHSLYDIRNCAKTFSIVLTSNKAYYSEALYWFITKLYFFLRHLTLDCQCHFWEARCHWFKWQLVFGYFFFT